MSQPVALGMDIGGTLVRVGAFDSAGQLLAQKEARIASIGPERGLRLIEGLIHETVEALRASVLGIGIGCTGPLDTVRGLVNNPYTLEGWRDVPIVSYLSDAFHVPVILENDADAAALGEYWQGAGRDAKRLYAVTVGTGVGTSLIIDGNIYRGVDGSHPEGGHQVIDPNGPECYCGQRGCWESLISGTAIASFARDQMLEADVSRLGGPEDIDTRRIAESARAGNPRAVSIMQKAARDFSRGVINIITLFVPDVLVLSGGVMKSADLFLPTLEKALHTPNPMAPFDRVQILPAKLGYYAGIYGGAYMILRETI